MIIWLASYPKSGNTWLRAILHRIIVNKTEDEKNCLLSLHKLSVNIQTKDKATFFNLGPKNDYEKILNKEVQFEIEKKFGNTMKKLNYL